MKLGSQIGSEIATQLPLYNLSAFNGLNNSTFEFLKPMPLSAHHTFHPRGLKITMVFIFHVNKSGIFK